MDVTHGEVVEAELDRLIRKRQDRRVAEEGREAWAVAEALKGTGDTDGA